MSAPLNDPKQLVAVYKKKGAFDKQRKSLLENFRASETHANLMLKLKLIVEGKVKADPTILMKNRGKVGALIQGNIIQQKASGEDNGILSIVDRDIQEKIIDSPEFHKILREELADINRRLMGVSDEDWEKEKAQKAKEADEAAAAADADARAATDREKRVPSLPDLPPQGRSSPAVGTPAAAATPGSSTGSSSTFGGYNLKPQKVMKAPKINIGHLKY